MWGLSPGEQFWPLLKKKGVTHFTSEFERSEHVQLSPSWLSLAYLLAHTKGAFWHELYHLANFLGRFCSYCGERKRIRRQRGLINWAGLIWGNLLVTGSLSWPV
jgi:hypothetical protein